MNKLDRKIREDPKCKTFTIFTKYRNSEDNTYNYFVVIINY